MLWTGRHGGLENPPELGHRKRVGYQMHMRGRAVWAHRRHAAVDLPRHHAQPVRYRRLGGAGGSCFGQFKYPLCFAICCEHLLICMCRMFAHSPMCACLVNVLFWALLLVVTCMLCAACCVLHVAC